MKALRTTLVASALTLASSTAHAQYSTPYRNVDNPDRFPFQMSVSVGVAAGTHNLIANFPLVAGKRIVIEYVSVGCRSTSASDTYPDAFLNTNVAAPTDLYQSVGMSLPNLQRGGPAIFNEKPWASAGPVKVYAESSSGFQIGVEHTDVTVPASCVMTVTGHSVSP